MLNVLPVLLTMVLGGPVSYDGYPNAVTCPVPQTIEVPVVAVVVDAPIAERRKPVRNVLKKVAKAKPLRKAVGKVLEKKPVRKALKKVVNVVRERKPLRKALKRVTQVRPLRRVAGLLRR